MQKRIIIEFQKKNYFTKINCSETAEQFIRRFIKEDNDSRQYELYSFLHGHIPEHTVFSEMKPSKDEKFFLQLKNSEDKITRTEQAQNPEDFQIPEIEFDIPDTERKLFARQHEILKPENYVGLNMTKFFADTQVKNCFLKPDLIQSLFNFCEANRREEEKIESGGFITGQLLKNENASFDVYLQKFVQPSVYNYRDEYRIEFGHTAMIELDAVLQANPEQHLLAWFHTHPGHGAFLSSYDLNAHYGSFTGTYQIALVTDNFTPNFETGIFTRKSNGEMNNRPELKKIYYLKTGHSE